MEQANAVIAAVAVWVAVAALMGCGVTLLIVSTVRSVRRGRARPRS